MCDVLDGKDEEETEYLLMAQDTGLTTPKHAVNHLRHQHRPPPVTLIHEGPSYASHRQKGPQLVKLVWAHA